MDILENLLIQINDWITWMDARTGLLRWQKLTIALAVLCVSLVLLIKQRKPVHRKVRIMQQEGDLPETIGPNLIKNLVSAHKTAPVQKRVSNQTPVVSEPALPHKRWKNATEEWKTTDEKIKQLHREITKSKRNEEHLAFQIGEMTKAYEQLMRENVRYKKIENELKHKIAELSYLNMRIINGVPQVKDINIGQTIQSTDINNSPQNAPAGNVKTVETTQFTPKTGIDLNSNLNFEIPDISDIDDLTSEDQPDEGKRRGIPLDIQELEAIAEMAKKLRHRSHNPQNESI
jgi:hypothetical protein